jgi:hypothetical protein
MASGLLVDWWSALMTCLWCGYRWGASYPDGTSRLECPNCHRFNPLGFTDAEGDQ